MSIHPSEHLRTGEAKYSIDDPRERVEFVRDAGEGFRDMMSTWLGVSGVGATLTPEEKERLGRGAVIFAERIAEHGSNFFEPNALRDVMEEVSPELGVERRRLDREASIDEVTGLPNVRQLNLALPAAERDPKVAVIFIDVNNFGEINKTISDQAGDDMLRYVAQHLKRVAEQVVGTHERVFRKGGDEFVILAPVEQAEELRQALVSEFGSFDKPPLPVDVEARGGKHYTKDHGEIGFVKLGKLKISLSAGVGKKENGDEGERPKKDIADNEAQHMKWSLKKINRKREFTKGAFKIPPNIIKRPIK